MPVNILSFESDNRCGLIFSLLKAVIQVWQALSTQYWGQYL